jgi:hypothetical protein
VCVLFCVCVRARVCVTYSQLFHTNSYCLLRIAFLGFQYIEFVYIGHNKTVATNQRENFDRRGRELAEGQSDEVNLNRFGSRAMRIKCVTKEITVSQSSCKRL